MITGYQSWRCDVSEHADSMRTIWYNAEDDSVCIIDQTKLPHTLQTITLETLADLSLIHI